MSSALLNSLQDEIDGAQDEIEYSYFLKLSDGQLADLIKENQDCECETFSESKLPSAVDGIFTRLRHYVTGEKYELTTKYPSDESKGKKEKNYDIDSRTYNNLDACAINKVIRSRIYLPVVTSSGPITRKDGTPLQWEIDAYLDARVYDQENIKYHNWIKLELEVDKATLETVEDFIPFEYEELIHSDSTNELERKKIDSLYNIDYNLVYDK